MTEGLLGIMAMFALALLRVPLGIAMGIVGFGGIWIMRSPNAAMASITNTIFDTGFQYTLAVIPLFVLMGNFVVGAGMAQNLYDAANRFVGHRKGGLANATIVSCAGFGAICGSAIATAATMTRVAHPSMKSYGYSDALATGAVAAGGTLGIMIPPSVLMIIYCIMTNTSIGEMFAAGLFPGLVAIACYMAAVRWTVWRDPDAGPATKRASWPERWRALRSVWAVLVLFGVVIGGIYGGIFTSTEAAGIGAIGGFFFAIFKGKLGPRAITRILVDSTTTAAMLFVILIGAFIFSNFINFTSLPRDLTGWISGLGLPPVLVVLVMCLTYVVLGAFLEELSVVLLTLPLFFPIISSLDVNPIWFGILVITVVEIGMISPPVGMNLFVISSMLPKTPTSEVWKGVLPFVLADLVRLVILIAFPAISLFLPGLLFS